MGAGSQRVDAPIHKGRRTILTIDGPGLQCAEPRFMLSRSYKEMARTKHSEVVDLERLDGVGWRLRPHVSDPAKLSRDTVGASSILTPSSGGLRAAPGVAQYDKSSSSPIPGATDGDSGGTLAVGDPHFTRQHVSGADASGSDYNLPDIVPLFSPPNTKEPYRGVGYPIATSGNHDWQAHPTLSHRFTHEQVRGKHDRLVRRDLFAGPVGWVYWSWLGTGEYALELYADGQASLFEKGHRVLGGAPLLTESWDEVFSFPWTSRSSAKKGEHQIVISTYYEPTRDQGKGSGSITFTVSEAVPETRTGTLAATQGHRKKFRELTHFTYPVPYYPLTSVGADPRPTAPRRPFAVGVPHGESGDDQIAISKVWPESGYVVDDPFTVPFPPSPGEPFKVAIDATIPPGCSITVEMFESLSGDALSQVPSGNPTEVWFTPVQSAMSYHAKFTLTGDSTKSPRLRAYVVGRLLVHTDPGLTASECVFFKSLSITYGDQDPGAESASFTIADPFLQLEAMKKRTGMRYSIETEYDGPNWSDPATRPLRARLSQGYVNLATFTPAPDYGRVGAGGGGPRRVDVQTLGLPLAIIPHRGWGTYDATCAGEWQRLETAVLPNRADYQFDPQTVDVEAGLTLPWLVTDIVYDLLRAAGYRDDQIDVPTLPIRAFNYSGDSWYVEPLARVPDLIRKLVWDYLGGIFFWNKSHGPDGAWSVRGQLVPSLAQPHYGNLCHFVSQPPRGEASLAERLPHVSGALGTFDYHGSAIPYVPVLGPLSLMAEQPECNQLMVSSSGILDDELTTLVLVNPTSYDFYPGRRTADPESPDYLGYVKPAAVFCHDFAGASGKDVDCLKWVARRYYDVMAHGTVHARFVAPLELFEPVENGRSRPRTLRYLDPVILDGVQYFVRDVVPSYRSDFAQVATYDLERFRGPKYDLPIS